MCIVVLVAHLVLSVLAALVVCVGYMYVLWCLECTWCCQCLLHLSYVSAICMCCGAWSTPGAVSACCTCRMCWLYVCVVVLGVHLVLSVLAALGICVGYCGEVVDLEGLELSVGRVFNPTLGVHQGSSLSL